MPYWQRHLQLFIRQVSKRVKINNNISTTNYKSSARNLESPFSQGYFQGLLKPTYSSSTLYHHLHQVKIAIIPKRKKVQAVLKAIKQSPKKVNLVAALVRGMRVEDALMQLQVTV